MLSLWSDILISGCRPVAPPGPNVATSFPVLVLPTDGADTRWAAEVLRRMDGDRTGFAGQPFAKLDADGNGKLSSAELAGWRKLPPDATWHLGLGKNPVWTSVVKAVGDRATASGWSRGRVRVDLRPDDGQLLEQARVARKRFLGQFTDADADRDGTVTAEEASKLKPAPLKALVPAADRNGDGHLVS